MRALSNQFGKCIVQPSWSVSSPVPCTCNRGITSSWRAHSSCGTALRVSRCCAANCNLLKCTAQCSALTAACAATVIPEACPSPNSALADSAGGCKLESPAVLLVPWPMVCDGWSGVDISLWACVGSCTGPLRWAALPAAAGVASGIQSSPGRPAKEPPCCTCMSADGSTCMGRMCACPCMRSTRRGAVPRGSRGRAAVGPRSPRIAASSNCTCSKNRVVGCFGCGVGVQCIGLAGVCGGAHATKLVCTHRLHCLLKYAH